MAGATTARDPRVNSSIDPDGTDDEGPTWDPDRGFPDDAEEEDDGDCA
jgi:hypothetical protein